LFVCLIYIVLTDWSYKFLPRECLGGVHSVAVRGVCEKLRVGVWRITAQQTS